MHSIKSMMLVSLFAALTAIGAFLQIPLGISPVPITLQTLFVFFAGFFLPAKEAFLSQVIYVAIGLIGIPIFTKGGGIQYLLDPSFGYLLAFLAVAPLISIAARKCSEPSWKVRGEFALCAIGITVLMEVFGVGYIFFISRVYLHTAMELSFALSLFLMFLPADLVKCVVGILLSREIKKRIPSK